MSGYRPQVDHASPPPYSGPSAGYDGGGTPYIVTAAIPPPRQPQGVARFGVPKYQDLWATVLFLVHLFGFFVLAVVGFGALTSQPNNDKADNRGVFSNAKDSRQFLGSVLTVAALAMFMAGGYLVLLQRYARRIIQITMIASIVFYFAIAIIYFYLGVVPGGILFILFGVLSIWFWLAARSQLDFASTMLETVASITRAYPSTILAAFICLIVQFIWSIFWGLVLVGCMLKFSNTGSFGGIAIFLAFSYYWTSQVIQNVLHVTISGVFATYYFLAGTAQEPVNPCGDSARRAMTTSFGSICFGSLIIALIETVRYMIRSAAGRDNFAAACADCLLGIIESYFRYFNRWAYTQVAIYGKSYCEAGKDTIDLLERGHVAGVINDCIISRVLFMGAILCGAVCAIIGYVWVLLAVDSNGAILSALACFFIGIIFFCVVTAPIDSGHLTTFICLCEDPAALARTKPELYQRFADTYPNVFQRVLVIIL